jgi:hypothetical protein
MSILGPFKHFETTTLTHRDSPRPPYFTTTRAASKTEIRWPLQATYGLKRQCHGFYNTLMDCTRRGLEKHMHGLSKHSPTSNSSLLHLKARSRPPLIERLSLRALSLLLFSIYVPALCSGRLNFTVGYRSVSYRTYTFLLSDNALSVIGSLI